MRWPTRCSCTGSCRATPGSWPPAPGGSTRRPGSCSGWPAPSPSSAGATEAASTRTTPPSRRVAMLPVGIVYEDRGRFRSQAAIQVGTPVRVDPWVERYRTDPREAVRGLTEEVTRGLRAVTVNHDTWDDLRLIDRAATAALADDRSLAFRYARRTELRRGLGAARVRTQGRD